MLIFIKVTAQIYAYEIIHRCVYYLPDMIKFVNIKYGNEGCVMLDDSIWPAVDGIPTIP